MEWVSVISWSYFCLINIHLKLKPFGVLDAKRWKYVLKRLLVWKCVYFAKKKQVLWSSFFFFTKASVTPVTFFQLTVWVFWLSEGDVICSRQNRELLLQVCQSFFSDPECCGYLHALLEEPKSKWVGSKNWKLWKWRILGPSSAGLQFGAAKSKGKSSLCYW